MQHYIIMTRTIDGTNKTKAIIFNPFTVVKSFKGKYAQEEALKYMAANNMPCDQVYPSYDAYHKAHGIV